MEESTMLLDPYEEEEEALSLCDLPIYSDDFSKEDGKNYSQSSNNDDDDFFEFFSEEFTTSTTTTTLSRLLLTQAIQRFQAFTKWIVYNKSLKSCSPSTQVVAPNLIL
ncbi:hypothetical protein SESBI_18440 [Sesbania bispinosa]|nr:hypothetical protein SESBI_18440 [Sesbania bispinosa]